MTYNTHGRGPSGERIDHHPHPSPLVEIPNARPTAAAEVQNAIAGLNVLPELSGLYFTVVLGKLILPIEVFNACSTLVVVGRAKTTLELILAVHGYLSASGRRPQPRDPLSETPRGSCKSAAPK